MGFKIDAVYKQSDLIDDSWRGSGILIYLEGELSNREQGEKYTNMCTEFYKRKAQTRPTKIK
jgi:hypothetical protein